MSGAVKIRLAHHHGWGNDFFVVDLADVPADRTPDWAQVARRVCRRDSETGGADGLLLMGRTGSGRLAMILHNADGSIAEISGNGIRCLVQAAQRAEGAPSGVRYTVDTGAGPRRVRITAGTAADAEITASAEMGPVSVVPAPAGWEALGCDPARPVHHVSVGNPHSVVGVESVADVDLADLGAKVPHVNLEIIEPGPAPGEVTMRVHERGVGVTRACGSGACAAAHAALAWGLVPASAESVLVRMDGGTATVAFVDGSAVLVGPSEYLGAVTVDL